MTSRSKKWVIVFVMAAVLAATAYFSIIKAVAHFLNNGALTRTIGKKTAVILQADSGYLPIFWSGFSVRSGGLRVRGQPPRALVEMDVLNLRASCSLEDLWRRKFTINRLQADHLQVAFGAAAATKLAPILPFEPEMQPQVETPSPLKLSIRETIVQQTDVFWGETPNVVGGLRGLQAKFYPSGSELDLQATGGALEQTGWPSLRVLQMRAHYAKPELKLQSALLSLGKSEDVALDGQFDFGSEGGMSVHARANRAPVQPFLNDFWRGKLEAEFTGENQIEKKSSAAAISADGQLSFEDAEVHDVPTLDQVAAVTRHPQFSHLKLSELRGRYKWRDAKLEVTDFRLEQKDLFRIEGEFVIENRKIAGTFQIGATADVLKSIPGAREKVFTESRDGYFWTPMKLSGPLNHPREDLKERLVSAAQEQFAKGFLAPILKPGKGLLEMLEALYQ